MKPASFFNYFGFGKTDIQVNEENKPVRALPGPWYISQEMFELERRAVFSRRWLMITHRSRFQQPGDWLRYAIAGFSFIITRDSSGNITAFHNICKHCAYPVVDGTSGTTGIFPCKCRGRSDELDGGLDVNKYGLFPIHVHIDFNGFIWVNLDAKCEPEVAWKDDFDMIDRQARFEGFDFNDYEYDHTWEMQTTYNWKLAADNYNECYHCKTTHPDLPAVADLAAYSVDVKDGYIIHNVATTAEQAKAGLRVCPTWYLPAASMNVMPNFFFIQKAIPHGPHSTTMSYEVYRNKNANEEDFDKVNQMYKRIMSEDKALCEAAQRNINSGTFVNGELHPRLEKGPLYFQKFVREAVTEHWKREQALGQQIWPARLSLPDTPIVMASGMDQLSSGLATQIKPAQLVC